MLTYVYIYEYGEFSGESCPVYFKSREGERVIRGDKRSIGLTSDLRLSQTDLSQTMGSSLRLPIGIPMWCVSHSCTVTCSVQLYCTECVCVDPTYIHTYHLPSTLQGDGSLVLLLGNR